uniref:Thyroglobulin type-1 domain-containing protein n=1 Tax=Oreochromis aureus TaxID=47969 RepID=A0AAZ1WWD9_OREAU
MLFYILFVIFPNSFFLVKTTSADGYPIVGVYKPQCDAEGQYLPQQCHGSTGYCWCVDSRGEERAGTRTPPGAPPVDFQPERAKTHCEHHRDSVKTTSDDEYPIVYKPQCDAEGQYLPQQCHGSTGYCWCVDSRGEERAGTRTPPGAPPVDCDRPGETLILVACTSFRFVILPLSCKKLWGIVVTLQ